MKKAQSPNACEPHGCGLRMGFVVATKDRSDDLRRLLGSLLEQTHPIDEVVIVDASEDPDHCLADEFATLNIRYVRFLGAPSAAAQRNAGVDAADESLALVAFVDDDTTFHNEAVSEMHRFWKNAPADVAGVAFNIVEVAGARRVGVKYSRFVQQMGLYSSCLGKVSLSGWQTTIGTVDENCYSEWLPTTAVVWRREILQNHRFDDHYQGYSYLEDVDFSYGISRYKRLAIAADAKYEHHHSSSSRMSPYDFGRMEVENRKYFVKKYGLSPSRCLAGILIRCAMTVGRFVRTWRVAFAQRAWGNVVELARGCVVGQK